MRSLKAILVFVTISSCQQIKQTPTLITDNFKYSSFRWFYTPENWEFYMDYHIDIDKTGHYKLMARDSFTSVPKYFSGTINDTVIDFINSSFILDTFKIDYKSEALQNSTYNGFTYCYDYTMNDTIKKKILFVQTKCPETIKVLSLLLDKVASNKTVKKLDSFDITEYLKEIKEYSSTYLGPLPKIEIPKFDSASK